MGLYYDTKGAYDALLAQVNANQNELEQVELDQATQDLAIAANEAAIMANEDGLQSLSDEVDVLAQAIASGGVIINRKIGAVADVPFNLGLTKVSFPSIINESQDQTVITFDVNNDHILLTKGQYSINAQLSLQNTGVQSRQVTLNLYALDLTTLVEDLIDTTGVVNITSNETVNIFPQYTYDKVSDNDILIFVRGFGDTQVNLKSSSSLHVNTVFTVAGGGAVSSSRNIKPYEPTLEGLLGTEATLNEVNKGFKARFVSILQAITSVGNNLNMTNNGRITNVAPPIDGGDVVNKDYFIANPTGQPYVTSGIGVSDQPNESVNGNKISQSGINIETASYNRAQERRDLIFDSVTKDYGLGGLMVLNDSFTSDLDLSSYDFLEITFSRTLTTAGKTVISKGKLKGTSSGGFSSLLLDSQNDLFMLSIGLSYDILNDLITYDSNRTMEFPVASMVATTNIVNDVSLLGILRIYGIKERS